jgi:hypothetical protein
VKNPPVVPAKAGTQGNLLRRLRGNERVIASIRAAGLFAAFDPSHCGGARIGVETRKLSVSREKRGLP